MPYLSRNYLKPGIVVQDKMLSYWKLLKKPDKAVLSDLVKRNYSFDLAHYDSDKSVDGRLFGYNIMFNLLNKGGIFISDDIQDNCAFAFFCEHNNLDSFVIKDKNKYQGIIIKK